MSDERTALPTWDQALQAAPAAPLPTWDEALNAPHPMLDALNTAGVRTVHEGSGPDAYFSHSPSGRVLDAFGQGWRQGWGADPSTLPPEFEDSMRKLGLFNEYDTGRRSLVKTFNEALFRAPATAYHAFTGLFGGVHQALIAGAEEGGPLSVAPAAGAAALEAFPLGRFTGLPARIPPRALPAELAEARNLKVVGPGGETGWKGLPTAADDIAGEPLPPPIEMAPEVAAARRVEDVAPSVPEGAVELPEVVVTPGEEAAVAREPPAAIGVAGEPTVVDTQPGMIAAGGTELPPEGPRRPATMAATSTPDTPNEIFAPRESAYRDKAGNIRLDNLGTPEDVNAVIREAADAGNDFIEARRGVIPDAQVSSLADALGMDAKMLDKRRLGEAFNAEQVMAARKLLVQSATDLRDLAARVEGGGETDLLTFVEAQARHRMIQEQVAGLTAEAGRALRAFRAIKGEAEAAEIGRILTNETGYTPNQLRQQARLIGKQDTPQQVSKTVDLLRKPNWKDMIVEAWINGLLSGPPTHIANMVGNTGVSVSSILETGLAAGIGGARRALGSRAERIYFGEVTARTFGLVKGSQEGVIAAGKALLDENVATRGPVRTLEQRRPQAIPSVKVNVGGIEMNLGGAQIRMPGRFLAAEDELFRGIAFRQEINALAYRQAANEGLSGSARDARIADLIENPPQPMVESARSHAAYQTFSNPLGPFGSRVQTAINQSVLAKVIVPFMRTPINLVKYAAERTPFGLLSREMRDNLTGKNGAIAQDTQLARLALGSAVMISVAGLASSTDMFPSITGAGPADPDANAKLRQTGWQPYSVKIGNFYYSYAWMDPLATIMGVTADLTQAVKAGRAEDAETSKVAAMLVSSLGKNLMTKVSLQGVTSLIQALTDPERYGEKFLQQIAGSVIPAAVALTARTQDPVLREVRSIGDTLKSRIPGLRQDLVPKIDVWGQSVPYQGAAGPDVLSRAYQSAITNDPVNLELTRLAMMPAALDRKIRGVELADRQYEDYARTAGRMTKMQLDKMVGSPGFVQWPDFAKREAVKHLVDGTREQARGLMMIRNPTIWQTALGAKKAEIHGATPEHVKSMLRHPAEAVSP
jgi:hypothetical protein